MSVSVEIKMSEKVVHIFIPGQLRRFVGSEGPEGSAGGQGQRIVTELHIQKESVYVFRGDWASGGKDELFGSVCRKLEDDPEGKRRAFALDQGEAMFFHILPADERTSFFGQRVSCSGVKIFFVKLSVDMEFGKSGDRSLGQEKCIKCFSEKKSAHEFFYMFDPDRQHFRCSFENKIAGDRLCNAVS